MRLLRNNPLAQAVRMATLGLLVGYAVPGLAATGTDSTSTNNDKKEDKLVVTSNTNTALKLDVPLAETPRAISSVDESSLRARSVQKIDQGLQYTSGVLATPYGTDNKADWLFIRGFPWSKYQDGLATINDDGFYTWQSEPWGVERLDVLKGPASVLYGQNPPGGLVNEVSKRPTRQPQGEINVQYGSDNYRHLAIDSSGPLNDDGSVLYRIVGLARDTNGSIDGAKSERYYLAPSLTFLGENTELTLLSSYMDTSGAPSNGFKLPYGTLHDTPFGKVGNTTNYGEPGFDRFDTRQFKLGYELTHHFSDTWSFVQNASYAYQNMDLRSVYLLGMVDDTHASRSLTYRDGFAQAWGLDSRVVGNWLMSNSENTLLVGIDYQNANVRSRDNNFALVGDPIDIFNPVRGNYPGPTDDQLFNYKANRNQTGYYIQNQFKYDDHWIFLAGGRYDRSRFRGQNLTAGTEIPTDDHKFSKTAGMMYQFDNGLSPYISYAESFQPLFERGPNNQAYKPQTGRQTEVGLKYSPNGFNGYVSAALYQLKQDNVLTTDPAAPTEQVQTGEARARGIELEGKAEVYKGLTLTANYTYNKVETTKSGKPEEIGKRLAAQPENMASAWVDYAFQGPLAGLTLGSGVRYVGSSYGDNTNSPDLKVPAYTLLDAMASYKIDKHWKVQVNASNLTNRDYVSVCNYWCYYGEGRKLSANVSYLW